jgi:hypothetical protein
MFVPLILLGCAASTLGLPLDEYQNHPPAHDKEGKDDFFLLKGNLELS